LNIVIQIVGSRGDIQPFVALGVALKQVGHRIRIATHADFKQLVDDHGLEFFDIGGDPKKLMAYMVRNPGLLPKFETIRTGQIKENRSDIREIMEGCWRSCFEDKRPAAHADSIDASKPFMANAIIANPPSFAHVHCAEKLGIPLHLMFT
jgi:UDP:flavonoid glycosyltransferase YjiC (YdhE family)